MLVLHVYLRAHRNKTPRMAAYFDWLKKEGHMSMTDYVNLCTHNLFTYIYVIRLFWLAKSRGTCPSRLSQLK